MDLSQASNLKKPHGKLRGQNVLRTKKRTEAEYPDKCGNVGPF